MKRNVALSLYDESGNMLRPWAQRGWDCYNVDLKNSHHVEEFASGGRMTWLGGDLRSSKLQRDLIRLRPQFMPSFPPCTDLATSGAKHFATKLARNPVYRKEAMELVYIGRDLILSAGACGFIENPRSVISTEWRKFDFRFDPCDFGGYLPANDEHPRWPDYIPPRDAYTKDTWIWQLNRFFLPPLKRVEPIVIEYANGVRGSQQFARLGGKSEKTKEIRSETARGFTLAVAEYLLPVLELEARLKSAA